MRDWEKQGEGVDRGGAAQERRDGHLRRDVTLKPADATAGKYKRSIHRITRLERKDQQGEKDITLRMKVDEEGAVIWVQRVCERLGETLGGGGEQKRCCTAKK